MDLTEMNERLLPDHNSQQDCSRRKASYIPHYGPTHPRSALLAFICLLVSVSGNIYQHALLRQSQSTKDLEHSQFSDSLPLGRTSLLTWLISGNRRLGL
jgi:hypothetical protein